MRIFNIQPTKKSLPWFKRNKLNIPALSTALTLLYAEIIPTKKVSTKKIILQILSQSDTSMYCFKTDKLLIANISFNKTDTQYFKYITIFDHILHEFRHWMQSQVYKKSPKELTYTDDDVMNNTVAYYRNELEKDARLFVRQNIKKFYKYYIHSTKIYQ